LGLIDLVAIIATAIGLAADLTALMTKSAVIELGGLGRWVNCKKIVDILVILVRAVRSQGGHRHNNCPQKT
jgi:hypothetical protein